jgi:hypothetical protein
MAPCNPYGDYRDVDPPGDDVVVVDAVRRVADAAAICS